MPGDLDLLLRGGMSRRRFLAATLAGSSLLVSQPLLSFAAGPSEPDGSEHARSEAERAIPFDKLRADTKAKLLSIVDRPTLYRRLPIQTFDCDHEMHVFLVRYPEVVVNIWQLMGITNIKAVRTSQYTIEGSDGAGTDSRVDLVYGTPDLHLFYCEGSYEGPLFRRKITGRSVLLLRSGYSFDRAKRPIVSDRLDVFLTVDNLGAELITKTLQTTVGRTIDSNFVETTKFLNRISDAAERNGPGMQQLAGKMTSCTDQVRQDFSQVSAGVSIRAAERLAQLTLPLQVQPAVQVQQPAALPAAAAQRR